jgi:hypothetical protein
MNSTPRCQDCGGAIEVDKGMGGRRAKSIQFCKRCTERHDTQQAAEKRRTIMLAILSAIGVLIAVGFLLARG